RSSIKTTRTTTSDDELEFRLDMIVRYCTVNWLICPLLICAGQGFPLRRQTAAIARDIWVSLESFNALWKCGDRVTAPPKELVSKTAPEPFNSFLGVRGSALA